MSVASFITIPAGSLLGAQAVLLSQLLGMLSSAVALDLWASKLKLSDVKQAFGFLIVFLGVVLDEFTANSGSRNNDTSLKMYILMIVGVYVIGIGYTFQASCNAALTEPLGGAARATLFTNCITITVSIPVWAVVWYGVGVQPELDFKGWPLWLGAGGLGALYNFSFAVIPQILGYTATYFMVLAGKLACSSVADAYGLTGTTIAFTWVRGAAVALVLIGTLLFSMPVKAVETALEDTTTEGPAENNLLRGNREDTGSASQKLTTVQ